MVDSLSPLPSGPSTVGDGRRKNGTELGVEGKEEVNEGVGYGRRIEGNEVSMGS